MLSRRTLFLATLALLLGACAASSEPTAAAPPSIAVTPAALTAGPPGTRTTVAVDVRGIGPAPAIEWVSVPATAVAVESVADAGRIAVLRVERQQAALIVVTAQGTRTLADTVYVTLAAARAAE